MSAITNLQSGTKGIFYYAPETATYPFGNTIPNPAMPTGAVWGGWADNPEVTEDQGSRPVYGLGSNEPQTIIPGGLAYSLSVATRIANIGLLQKCLRGSGGYGGLADLCLITGLSNVDGDGYSRALRYAKCASLGFNFQEGSAAPLTAQMQFWALAENATTAVTPTNTDFGAYGSELNWHSLSQVLVNGVNVRDTLSAFTLNINHNLERKNWRPDYGPASPWSRTTYALLPRTVSYDMSMVFHSPDAKKSVLALLNSATETGPIQLVAGNAGTSTEGSYASGFVLNVAAGRVGTTTRRGGGVDNELMSTLSIIPTGVTLTDTSDDA